MADDQKIFESSLSRAKGLAAEIRKAAEQDILSVDTKTVSKSQTSRSTVGLVLTGTSVDTMVVGGPADLSQQLRKGDDIKTVDGKRVDSEDVRERQPQPQIHGSLSIEWRCDVAVGRWQPFSVDPTSPDRLCCLRSNEQARYTTNRADVSGVPPPQLPLQGEWRCLSLRPSTVDAELVF